jgi:branched-chain amino acid transport system substrate-binding protein
MTIRNCFGALAALVLLAGCQKSTGGLKDFEIGAYYPMTGPSAVLGRDFNRGASLAIEQINAAGGVAGYKLRLEVIDFQNSDVNLAITGLQKLISVDKISVCLGTYSAVNLACQPVAARNHVVVINGAAWSPKLINLPYFHTTRLSLAGSIPMFMDFVWDQGVRRLAILYQNDASGISGKDVAVTTWKAKGGEIVAEEAHESTETDFTAQISRLKAKNPDGLFDVSAVNSQYAVKRAREMGMSIPLFLQELTEDDAKVISPNDQHDVLMCADSFDRLLDNAFTQKLVKAYDAKWTDPITMYVANQYEGVYIIAELIRRVVATGGNPKDGAQLEAAIAQDRTFDSVYGGKITLFADGTAAKPVRISTLKDGKIVLVKTIAPK